MKTIRVLQLGAADFSRTLRIIDGTDWYYEPGLSQEAEDAPKEFELAILDREITEEEFSVLARSLRAYTLFATERAALEEDGWARRLMARKKGKRISAEELRVLLEKDLPDYFAGSYGEKIPPQEMALALGFQGSVFWEGYEGLHLRGDFGSELLQIVSWRINTPIESGQALEYWLEYKKDASVEIRLEIAVLMYGYGTIPEISKVWSFSEKDMEDMIYIENPEKRTGRTFVSLKARGQGELTIGALHSHYSRRGRGCFLPGGQRRVTSEREEVFYYFDPGDLTPPLNVYFSGYKTKEGFEGYGIMKNLGHPFLLITDTRLEGGAAYMGSEEYERTLEQIIRDRMQELGFQNTEVILSGISMGSFGALYYGCKIQPHAVIAGKPLVSFGDIAENERINRPGGFPTSLDVLHKFCGGLSRRAADRLNQKFWDTFDGTQWSHTEFALAYMIEDDYDNTAYEKLLSHLKGTSIKIYGKGLHGRHNDDTPGIVNWFLDQYQRILEEDFEGNRTETAGRKS